MNNRIVIKPSVLQYIAGFCVAVVISFTLTYGFQYNLCLFIGFVIFVIIAYRHPLLIVSAHFIFSIFPNLFRLAVEDPYSWRNLAKGIGFHDMILCAMITAIFLKLRPFAKSTSAQGYETGRCYLGIGKYVIMFSLWLMVEIVRNIRPYGLSAPGEFRSHYLILALPLYIAVFFDSTDKRVNLYKIIILTGLYLPLLLIPLIGELKGWSIGPANRFFHAFISLGILYGIFASAMATKYGFIKVPKMLFWLMSAAAALIIILDSHRSVWFTAAIIFFLMVWFKEVKPRKFWGNSLFYAAFVLCIVLPTSAVITSVMEKGLIEFVAERSGDIFKIDESYNTTTAWRVAKWKVQMQRFSASPFTGLGFGGYWGVSGPEDDVGVSPHNLYVQILVKLGVIGLVLYLLIIACILRNIKKGIKVLREQNDPEIAILISGIIVLLASHAFYIVYSLEDYSWIFIGLSIAVLRSKLCQYRFHNSIRRERMAGNAL